MTSVVELPAPERQRDTAVGLVDCDVHNYWTEWSELFPYLSKRWQDYVSEFGARHFPGGGYPRFWADPDEKRPPSGRRAGGDAGFMATDHLDRHDIAYAILIPLTPVTGLPNLEFSGVLARAINDWQAECWLDPDPRMRASIVVSTEDVPQAVAEIERRATDRRFVQLAFSGRPQEPMGRRKYWPIYEACVAAGIPVMSHAFGSTGNPITGAGWASYYIEDHVGPPQAMQANIASLAMEGVFERFPTLNVVSVENGFGWLPPLTWRMDDAWSLLRHEVPHVRRPPSEYVAEHVFLATQPVEEPEKRRFFQHLLDQYPPFADRLVFSSDYPHWDGDTPERALPLVHDPAVRDKILRRNARQLYGLA